MLEAIRARMRAMGRPRDRDVLQRFFKTAPGQYGAGDVFLGIRVPKTRALLREFPGAGLHEARALLPSAIHEERLFALLLLVRAFQGGDDRHRLAHQSVTPLAAPEDGTRSSDLRDFAMRSRKPRA